MTALPNLLSRARPTDSPFSRPDLRVVGPPRHGRSYTVVFTLVLAFGVFGVVGLNALAAEAAFEARELEGQVDRLSLRYDELTARVAKLETPGRVRRVAIDELGMVPAEQPGYLVVHGGAASRVRQTAARGVSSDPVKQAMSLQR